MNTMDSLRSRLSSDGTIAVQNENGYIGNAGFVWKSGAEKIDIDTVEDSLGLLLPQSYRDFLVYSNGAILFKETTFAQWGCVLLGTSEVLTATNKVRESGLNIPQHWIVFAQWLGDGDLLVFDLKRSSELTLPYIIDGDVGYPVKEWEYISGDFLTWIDRLIVAQGAKYWRWC